MPDQPKPPQGTQATPLVRMLQTIRRNCAGDARVCRDLSKAIKQAKAESEALHALAGALDRINRISTGELQVAESDTEGLDVVREVSANALATYRTLTSADERRGG